MWAWIDRLRQKPKAVRDQYAFFAAAGIAGVIAMIWVATLPNHFARMVEPTTGPEQEAVGAFKRFFTDAKLNLGAIVTSTLIKSTSTEAVATTTPLPAGLVIPTLEEETIQQVTGDTKPRFGRPVLIESSRSASVTASTTSN